MKTLKFAGNLVESILNGQKTNTWRLFDDKGLKIGDKLKFVEKETDKHFANAEIINVREKAVKELSQEELLNHGYTKVEDMLFSHKKYYGDMVSLDTVVKMINFKLI